MSTLKNPPQEHNKEIEKHSKFLYYVLFSLFVWFIITIILFIYLGTGIIDLTYEGDVCLEYYDQSETHNCEYLRCVMDEYHPQLGESYKESNYNACVMSRERGKSPYFFVLSDNLTISSSSS